MSRWARVVLLAGGLGIALPTSAARAMEVERLEVAEQGPAYSVDFEARLAAPAEAVMAVLQDYARYPQLDDRIAEVRVLQDGGQSVLYTRIRGCVGSVFCRELERFEQVTAGSQELVAEAIPGRGDLVAGRTVTRVVADGDGTRVSYRSRFQPSFWMPRWMVRSAMHQTLEDGTRQMFANVERRAQLRGRP